MTKTIQLTEREIQALLYAIETARNCYDWDYELDASEREDHKAWKRVYDKANEAYFG